MSDKNECLFTGAVEGWRTIQTKTGTPMAVFTLNCGQEKIKVVCFKELAERPPLADGCRVEISGRIQSTSWQDKDGNKRFGWQVVANTISMEQGQQAAPPPVQEPPWEAPPRQPDQEQLFNPPGRQPGQPPIPPYDPTLPF